MKACFMYGATLFKLAEYEQAIRYSERVFEIANALDELDPLNRLRIQRNVGMMHKAVGDWDKALSIYEDNLMATEKALGSLDLETAYVHYNLGSLLSSMEAYSEALRHYQQALKIRRGKLPGYHPDVIESLNNMGELMLDMSDLDVRIVLGISYILKGRRSRRVGGEYLLDALRIWCIFPPLPPRAGAYALSRLRSRSDASPSAPRRLTRPRLRAGVR